MDLRPALGRCARPTSRLLRMAISQISLWIALRDTPHAQPGRPAISKLNAFPSASEATGGHEYGCPATTSHAGAPPPAQLGKGRACARGDALRRRYPGAATRRADHGRGGVLSGPAPGGQPALRGHKPQALAPDVVGAHRTAPAGTSKTGSRNCITASQIDRTASGRFLANQLRSLLTAAAYVLVQVLRPRRPRAPNIATPRSARCASGC